MNVIGTLTDEFDRSVLFGGELIVDMEEVNRWYIPILRWLIRGLPSDAADENLLREWEHVGARLRVVAGPVNDKRFKGEACVTLDMRGDLTVHGLGRTEVTILQPQDNLSKGGSHYDRPQYHD